MAKDIKLFGKEIPEWAVWSTGGLAVVGGVLWYRKKANAAAASSSNQNSVDPVTGLPYSEDSTVDPLTGQTYLSEAQEYGSVSAAEAAYASQNEAEQEQASQSEASGSGSGSAYDYGYGGTGTSTTTYLSNADWGSAAIAYLEQLGYSSSDASGAINAYLAGATLTTSQAALVQSAIADLGNPPSALPVQSSSGSVSSNSGSTQTGTSGTGSGGSATVPDCAGLTTGAAHNAIVAADLKPTAPSGQTDALTCTGTNPPAGTVLATGSSVEILASGVAVPNCKGITAGAAHNAITAAGLHATAPSGQKATAICTGTSPAAGQQVASGSNVEILT